MKISDTELQCLTLLGFLGESELSEFCNIAVEKQVFKSVQTVRNFISKAQREGMISKSGVSRKKIKLNPELQIECKGTILFNLKAVYIAAQELQAVH